MTAEGAVYAIIQPKVKVRQRGQSSVRQLMSGAEAAAQDETGFGDHVCLEIKAMGDLELFPTAVLIPAVHEEHTAEESMMSGGAPGRIEDAAADEPPQMITEIIDEDASTKKACVGLGGVDTAEEEGESKGDALSASQVQEDTDQERTALDEDMPVAAPVVTTGSNQSNKRKVGQGEDTSAKKMCVEHGVELGDVAVIEASEVVERGADALEQAAHAMIVQNEPAVRRESKMCITVKHPSGQSYRQWAW